MSEKQSFDSNGMVKQIVMYGATVLITIIISMTGFWMMMGRDFVTRAEAKEIAIEQVVLVDQKLEIYRQDTKETRSVINKNSEVINELRVEIAKLTQALHGINNTDDN